MPSSAPATFLDQLVRDHEAFQLDWRIRHDAEGVLQRLLAMLFPHFGDPGWRCPLTLDRCAEGIERDLEDICIRAGSPGAARSLFGALPAAYQGMRLDLNGLEETDPAAQGPEEVMLAYPGFLAVCVHRLAQALPARIIPRIWSEWAHRQTGIDIHPSARVAAPLIIDHGTGIVIGATAEIGPRVRLYQGVTLGALSVKKSLAGAKRHPTIEADVTIYAGATILGGETVVGKGSLIGGNAWVTRSVPPGSVVTRSNTPKAPEGATSDPISALRES